MTPPAGKPNPFLIVSNPKPVPPGAVLEKDPVCHMDVYPPNAAGSHDHNGRSYHFCSKGCLEKFRADPSRYAEPGDRAEPQPESRPVPTHSPTSAVEYTCPMDPEIVQIGPGICPKCGMALEPKVFSLTAEEDTSELDDMKRRFGISLALTLPVFLLAIVPMALVEMVKLLRRPRAAA